MTKKEGAFEEWKGGRKNKKRKKQYFMDLPIVRAHAVMTKRGLDGWGYPGPAPCDLGYRGFAKTQEPLHIIIISS